MRVSTGGASVCGGSGAGAIQQHEMSARPFLVAVMRTRLSPAASSTTVCGSEAALTVRLRRLAPVARTDAPPVAQSTSSTASAPGGRSICSTAPPSSPVVAQAFTIVVALAARLGVSNTVKVAPSACSGLGPSLRRRSKRTQVRSGTGVRGGPTGHAPARSSIRPRA